MPVATAPRRPDARFWVMHLALPLLAAAVLIGLAESTEIDLWLADRWYALEGSTWALSGHWLTCTVIHHYGKELVIAFGIVLMTLFAASFRIERIARWRLPLGYLMTCMVVLPALLTRAKRYSPVPCPADLARYGGDIAYQAYFGLVTGIKEIGHCFPSGHASGGFALLAVYFAALPSARRPAYYLLPGLLTGWTFALGQQARGAHFISHDLWTTSLCWFGALGLFLLFRPGRWAAPGIRKALN